jgi:hypothetical protein
MRVLFSDNGVLTEITEKLRDYATNEFTLSMVAAEDAIYLGSELPFNHFFIKMGTTVNALASVLGIAYWAGRSYGWVDVVDKVDLTGGSTTLAASGHVDFVPNKDRAWARESTNHEAQQVTGLTSVVIYDRYWLKLTVSGNLTASVIIKWIGQLFSNDADLFSEYPQLRPTSLMALWETGKTSWEEQAVVASQKLADDLIAKMAIVNKAQVLDREQFRLANASRTAQVIYSGLGTDFADDALAARGEYRELLASSLKRVDKNADGILNVEERTNTVGWLTR